MFFNSERDKALEILRHCGLPTQGDFWWVRYPVRAVEEIYKMRENTNAIMSRVGQILEWDEWITNNFGNVFQIKIEIDQSFPSFMPEVYLEYPKLDNDNVPHSFGDGSLCLMHEDDYSSKMSILDIRNAACAWCWCYDLYKQTGEWPAAERAHD